MKINDYGDQRILAGDGRHGIDVASQRADVLDQAALDHLLALIADGRNPTAADLGCGAGGQVARMAATGARVLGVDLCCPAAPIEQQMPSATFIQLDLRNMAPARATLPLSPFDVVVCQRTIHYLKASEAVPLLFALASRYMAAGGRLYISASGMASELATGYPDRDAPLHRRYAELSLEMQQKHGILGPVCLYRETELADMVEAAGFRILDASNSAFGNAKVAAELRAG